MNRILFLFIFSTAAFTGYSQRTFQGEIRNAQTNEAVPGATIKLKDSTLSRLADEKGYFSFGLQANAVVMISASGFDTKKITLTKDHQVIFLEPAQKELDAVVVTGTMRAVRKLESPIAVEVYSPAFLKKNPSPSIFESLQNVNGVRPQLNCSVCNTGDIHINGLEGPYTMVTIDGMPIVSSLSSVYGLFGIPTQLIERIEIVKGPASGLYGAEAIGGLINIITKSPEKAPAVSINLMTTTWLEHNVDMGFKWKAAKKTSVLTGINYFNYQHPYDKNADGFTDVTLQHRISVFNKISFQRKMQRQASLAARYFYENRWGGEMNWNKSFRGTDQVYGESIYTNRWELIGNYQLPVDEKIFFSFSATGHKQDSYYGLVPYFGKQKIGFGQLIWDKSVANVHSFIAGLAGRYNYYDDNSTATLDTLTGVNKPDRNIIPGVFIQGQWKLSSKSELLLGMRWDYHPVHKNIFTPRIAWKYSLGDHEVFRLNAGTGFRVVSLFTEEHAALTGSRVVEIRESLKPEQSYNVNLNYSKLWKATNFNVNVDASAWYSYFTNQIIADYLTDPQKIIYNNLHGHSISKGLTLNTEWNIRHRIKALVGITLQDVAKFEKGSSGKVIKELPMLTEKWSGTWAITYNFPGNGMTIDYTGNIYGPMKLPLISELDPRPANSPVWSIQNIQFSKKLGKTIEIFAGIKNMLNWTPVKNTPFLIARANDPFDKQVQFDAAGKAMVTPTNPYGLTFDPSYVYAPNQGRRGFLGIRLNVK
jgi:outer membrane receptor for ferrienterochelin and colicins